MKIFTLRTDTFTLNFNLILSGPNSSSSTLRGVSGSPRRGPRGCRCVAVSYITLCIYMPYMTIFYTFIHLLYTCIHLVYTHTYT